MQVDTLQPFSTRYNIIRARAVNKKDTTYIKAVNYYYSINKDKRNINPLLDLHLDEIKSYLESTREDDYCSIGTALYYYRHEVEKLGFFRDFEGGLYISLINHLDVVLANIFKLPIALINQSIIDYKRVSRVVLTGRISAEEHINLKLFMDIDSKIETYIKDLASLTTNEGYKDEEFLFQLNKKFLTRITEESQRILHKCVDVLISEGFNLGVRTTNCYSIICTKHKYQKLPTSLTLKYNQENLELPIYVFQHESFLEWMLKGVYL